MYFQKRFTLIRLCDKIILLTVKLLNISKRVNKMESTGRVKALDRKQNLHTHSLFCDGKNTIEETVVEAIERGFDSIGFSSHSYTPFDESYCIKKDSTQLYLAECERVKLKYKDKIKVFCGLEQDIYSKKTLDRLDFIIGAVHYVKVENIYVSVDESADLILDAVRKYFRNDIYAFVEKYYSNVENAKKATNCDIIAHFDLVTKFSERVDLIDENNPRYVAAYEKALSKLVSDNVIFELNSGAVARGWRSSFYPSPKILNKIAELKGKITFSSDCHDKSKLDFLFPEMRRAALRAGFDEIYVLTDNGFVPMPLD